VQDGGGGPDDEGPVLVGGGGAVDDEGEPVRLGRWVGEGDVGAGVGVGAGPASGLGHPQPGRGELGDDGDHVHPGVVGDRHEIGPRAVGERFGEVLERDGDGHPPTVGTVRGAAACRPTLEHLYVLGLCTTSAGVPSPSTAVVLLPGGVGGGG